MLRRVLAVSAVLLTAGRASAGPILWTDWTSATIGDSGSASGSLDLGQGAITLSYAGDVSGSTQTSGGGTDYWIPSAPYLSATVSNSPSPNTDIITLDTANGGALNTIRFSTPVWNPVMALVSLGTPSLSVDYAFDQSFTLLSSGTGFWGGGSPSLFDLGGNVLRGVEGHGAIQFHGAVSSISWSTSPDEDWHGFQIGAAPVPEPGTLGLLGSGLLLGLWRRRRRG